MSVTFLHTADWQLGKPFASVQDVAKRNRLQQERIQSIRNLKQHITEHNVSFVLVAGDLFDSSKATRSTVSAACAAIGFLQIPVIVIPGNHDHGGPGTIWEQEFFLREKSQLAPNLEILTSSKPLNLDSAVILPAPLLRRHESSDPTSWIRSAFTEDAIHPSLPRILLAHGTIQGFSASQDDEDSESSVINFIDLKTLPENEIDYFALGDWHGTKQINDKAWYSGTPEIDRFPKGEDNDPGNILIVKAARNTLPEVQRINSSSLLWKHLHFRFSDDESFKIFNEKLDELLGNQSDVTLLHLTLEGSLGIAASENLDELLESLNSRLIRLKLYSKIRIAPSPDELAALTQRAEDPLISSVATKLITDLESSSELDEAVTHLALRELYSAIS